MDQWRHSLLLTPLLTCSSFPRINWKEFGKLGVSNNMLKDLDSTDLWVFSVYGKLRYSSIHDIKKSKEFYKESLRVILKWFLKIEQFLNHINDFRSCGNNKP